MTRPARQRPGSTSEVGRRLQPSVESHLPGTTPAEQAANQPAPLVPVSTTRTDLTDENIKESFSTRLPRTTLAAAKAAVMATAGQTGGCRSLSELVTQAVNSKVAELEHQFNDGQPFPTPGAFRAGRPLGS